MMLDLIHQIIDFAKTNQMFSGIAAAGGFASVIYWAKALPTRIVKYIVWAFSVEIEISNDSDAYQPFLRWLEANAKSWHTRNFKLSSERGSTARNDGPVSICDDDEDETRHWIVAPGAGNHLIWFRGWPYRASREIGGGAPDSGGGSMKDFLRPREVIRIKTPGFRKDRLERLIDTIKRGLVREKTLPVQIWRWSSWDSVRNFTPRRLETIVLADGMKGRLTADLENFRSSKEWYEERGIPWRRGYLFAGTPGTGKSSLAVALAGSFRMPICVLNLGSIKEDGALFEAMNRVPSGSLVLMEDVDTVAVTATRDGDAPPAGITLGALLNVLDGALAEEGRVLIMTTNHPDKIDPALLRPGRVDVRFDFEPAGPKEISEMYRLFFGREFTAPDRASISPAIVQGICLEHAGDADAAATELLGAIAWRDTKTGRAA